MFDVIIRGGEVVDGTGAPRRRADVGIRDGRIVEIGIIDADASRVIDATGKVVAPGFVDVHTHYDAQVFWDSALTPSPQHGVTTVLAGNCGFTIAPLSDDPSDGEYLMRMLARVEGMPLESLQTGVPWSWKSTAEYLDTIEGNLGVNAGFMVGHSAIRRVVMGAAANQRAATADELAAMSKLLHDGLDAGGMGFSSSWARTHNDGDRAMVPSRHATREELLEFCRVVGEHAGTSLEFIPMVGPFEPWAVELMADMSATAKRPLNWNLLAVNAKNADEAPGKLAAGDLARERGGKVVALTVPVSVPLRISFAAGFTLDAMKGWEELMLAPMERKLEVFSDPEQRAALNELAQAPDNPMRGLANWSTKHIFDVVAEENRKYIGHTVGEIAAAEGEDPWDTLCRIALADGLRTSFGINPGPDSREDWLARRDVWRDSRAIMGASDAGAHLDMLATFNYATLVLADAVRTHGVISLEEAIHRMTDVPARLYGLIDRGRIEAGWHADVIVIDPDTVGSDPIEMQYDLPGGAGRLYADSRGVEHVLVNGRAIIAEGKLTADRPGTLLRSGTHTRTADLT